MRKRNWKELVDNIAKINNYKIVEYPKSSKEYVYFIDESLGLDILKQVADRFIKNIPISKKSHKLVGIKNRLSANTIINKIESILSNSNSVYVSGLENYKNNNTNLKFKCSNCGEIYCRSLTNLKKNNRCPKCERARNRVYGKTNKKFKEDVYEVFGNEYTVIGEYTNARDKIEICHNICNTVFFTPAGRFLREEGFKCPTCFGYVSRGELSIKRFLEKKNILFERQYQYDDLKLDKNLSFDFYIANMNMLIEFDGEQHFREIEYFTRTTPFEKVVKSDELKNEYCKKLNIKLLRIPFWELYNINEILEFVFMNNNLSIEEIENQLEYKNIYLNRKYFNKFKSKKI